MAGSESAATPGRLARITVAHAIETVAETAVFGTLGLFFAFVGLVIATVAGVPGAETFGDYLFASSDIFVYLFASAVIYVTLLTAFRAKLDAGISSFSTFEEDEPDSKIQAIIEKIDSMISFASYTASTIVIGGILTYEVMRASPILGIVVLVGYQYFEHYALVASAREAETKEDAPSPITPAILGAAVIAMVTALITSPILIILRVIGTIASLQEYFPSFEHVTSSIRGIQERPVFMGKVLGKRRKIS